MHACMHNMFTKSFSSPDKNLMCCARQFSFIAIVVFMMLRNLLQNLAIVITWYQMNEQTSYSATGLESRFFVLWVL